MKVHAIACLCLCSLILAGCEDRKKSRRSGNSDEQTEVTQPKTLKEWAILLQGKTRKEVVEALGPPTSHQDEPDWYILRYRKMVHDPVVQKNEYLNLMFTPESEKLMLMSQHHLYPLTKMQFVDNLVNESD